MLQISSSFRKFLCESDNKVAQFIMRGIHYQNRDYGSHRLMIRSNEVNYLTLRDDGTISYLPKGKEHKITDDGRWTRDGRQNGRAATIIKKVLTPRAVKLFKDVEFEQFVNQYKAVCDAEFKQFVIRPNVDIPNVYCMTREGGGGTLNDSCMNGDEEYLEIYARCPHLRILTMINKDGELAGRALLWNTEDGVLMDRIYVSRDHYYDMFLEYADTNKFIRKVEYKSYRDKDKYVKEGTVFRKAYKIATPTDFSYYPYIDTFTYGGDGFLCNDYSFSDIHYEYTITSGTREGCSREMCAATGEMHVNDDLRYIDVGMYSGESIHYGLAVYCITDTYYYHMDDENIVYVSSRGDYYRIDDDHIVEINGYYYHTDYDEVEYSNWTNQYHLADEIVWSDHHEDYLLCEDAVQVADIGVFHKDDISSVD